MLSHPNNNELTSDDFTSVSKLVRPWCTRMWYVSGLRPDWAQVGRFSSWGTFVAKGFLAESAYFSSCISHR